MSLSHSRAVRCGRTTSSTAPNASPGACWRMPPSRANRSAGAMKGTIQRITSIISPGGIDDTSAPCTAISSSSV